MHEDLQLALESGALSVEETAEADALIREAASGVDAALLHEAGVPMRDSAPEPRETGFERMSEAQQDAWLGTHGVPVLDVCSVGDLSVVESLALIERIGEARCGEFSDLIGVPFTPAAFLGEEARLRETFGLDKPDRHLSALQQLKEAGIPTREGSGADISELADTESAEDAIGARLSESDARGLLVAEVCR